MSNIPISEVFYTLQGEGRNTGKPVIFIRFWGCNKRCNFCLLGDTDIDGKKIKDIKEGDIVKSYNTQKNIIEKDKVVKIMEREVDEIYEINLNNGKKIQITGNHEIYTNEGRKQVCNLSGKEILYTS